MIKNGMRDFDSVNHEIKEFNLNSEKYLERAKFVV